MRKIVIASGNHGKLREIRQILAPLDFEVVPQSELGVPEAEEPHDTFLENALEKARHASRITGLPALADDSGICVHALNGEPGIHSARFAGAPRSDERNNLRLLEELKNSANRRAHFYCVIVYMRHAADPEPLIAEGRWEGEILEEYRGEGGFGYDPLFFDPDLGKSAAQLSHEIKNRVSHRARALSEFLRKLGCA
ncbi:MAG: RdgB/HAM1 family non-canonical purine NTP pyrophosphatase [Burkholderiales bacterium]|nr:RdgB/HAM1 family non-canonical purine NTP pyrophosphatase [Burkholderiales bacterium]